MLQKLSYAIIGPSDRNSARLREALRASVVRLKGEQEASFPEFAKSLKRRESLDIVFVSSVFPEEDLETFVSATNESSSSLKIVLLVQEKDNDSAFIARMLACGVDAFLCPPYSPAALLELLTHAREVDLEGSDENRQKGSAWLLLGSAMKSLDNAAREYLRGNSAGGAGMKSLRKQAGALKRIEEQLGIEALVGIYLKRFEEAKPFADRQKSRSKSKASRALHPGHILRADMQKRGITEERLASSLALEKKELQEFLSGNSQLDEELAEKLARIIGRDKEEWLTFQEHFQKQQASNTTTGEKE